MKIAFFGHDSSDAAVKKRVRSMQQDGIDVVGFMMYRRATTLSYKNIDLGQTYDGKFLQRIKQVWTGARKAAKHRTELESTDVIFARNLDMLLCAYLTKAFLGLKTPVIYESIDIHRLLYRRDLLGSFMRLIERHFLRRSKGVIVSSPGFLEHHFEKYYKGEYKHVLIENRGSEGTFVPARPRTKETWAPSEASTRPLSLGWVGMLRCQRSLDMMCLLAEQFKDQLVIKLHGIPALVEVPNFEAQIEQHQNITYAGRFSAPEDLFEIYSGIDIVWAGDFMDAGSNSDWLLPNRIYEGGYFAVPPVAPIGTQTEKWISERACGYSITPDVETSFAKLITQILAGDVDLSVTTKQLLDLEEETFVEPKGFIRESLEYLLSDNSIAPGANQPARQLSSDSLSGSPS